MPTEELKKALEERKMNNAEKDVLDILSRAFDVPRELLYRIIYGYERLHVHLDGTEYGMGFPKLEWSEGLSGDLREAINLAMANGAKRLLVRYAIENAKALSVATKDLVPADKPEQLCHGCPERIECISESLSTPSECLTGRHATTIVYPIQIHRAEVEIETQQPAGRHRVPLRLIHARQGDTP